MLCSRGTRGRGTLCMYPLGRFPTTEVNNKCCVQLAIIGHLVTLDEVLEAIDVGDGFLAKPTKYL